MLKLQMRRLSEGPRILALMLAIMLPAAALIVFGAYHLRNLQRDKAIEAAIQRDYQQVLEIAEKRIDERAFGVAEAARATFPSVQEPDELQEFLDKHPEIAYAMMWRGKGTLQFKSQASRQVNSQLCVDDKAMAGQLGIWLDMDAPAYLAKLHKIAATEGRHLYITDHYSMLADKPHYQSLVMFTPEGASREHPALAGFIYDTDYLRKTFFPAALNDVLPQQRYEDKSHPHPAIMVRWDRDKYPLATSANWDEGKPEVERPFEGVFPGLVLGIKLRGTTIAIISDRFLRTSFLILAALSLLMIGGMVLTYRSVTRELALAKLKSDFVSNVSHELRTPLALIRLYAETLELGRIAHSGKQQEYYEIIRKESERLTALINNILDFSRIESGKKEYTFRETNVAELVRSTLDSYRFEIEQGGFQLEEKIDTDVPPLVVDREAIARSLLNLVNNAVKYSVDDRYIGVSLYRCDARVNLEVADRGIGIATKDQHRIFEKFYRVCDPLVHNTKGSGLGLSLVQHIVQAHGGAVGVESAPGKGSRFIISLPLESAGNQHLNGASA